MAFKFTLAHFNAPTPKKMKRIGNALVTLSTSTGAFTALAQHVWIGIAIAALGILGKVILSFYAEDDTTESKLNM